MSCNNSVVLSNRLSRWASKSENERTCFDSGWPWGKRPGFFDLMAFFRSPIIFCTVVQCWQSWQWHQTSCSDNSKTNVKEHMHVPVRSHTKCTTRRFCPQHPTLTPGAGSKSVRRYLYIYIYRQKAKSTRNCGARLRLAPIIAMQNIDRKTVEHWCRADQGSEWF